MFVKKPLADGVTLGERLRALREHTGISAEDIARKSSITPKYLVAIEESRYSDLPGKIYAQQFVRKYAEALETDVEMAMDLFDHEYAVVTNAKPSDRPLLTPRASTEFHWTRRHARLIVAIIAIALVMAYLGTQAVKNFLPPKLVVTEPAKEMSTTEYSIVVAGTTDQNATVTINDQSVQTSGDGTFREKIDLRLGLNTLNVSAVKKHGSARVVTRQVLVEEKTNP